jgi:hypothetical protein
MMALDEIQRLLSELRDDLEHGQPLDTFKLGMIARIAQEQIALAELEAKP